MAESTESSNSSLSDVRATLLRVADRLSALQEPGPSNSPTQSSTPVHQSSTPAPVHQFVNPTQSSAPLHQSSTPAPVHAHHSVTPAVPRLSASSASVAAEQRRLFGFGSSAKRPRPSTKCKRGATCTLKFVCLASAEEASRPPMSVKERTALANAGLGDASITFNVNKSSVYNGILERFPQLSEAGGFDLMLFQRGAGEGAGFHKIHPPHTPSKLKELCGQAKIYIRPLQKDIGPTGGDQEGEETVSDVPVVKCFTCGAEIIMTEMQKHQDTHLHLQETQNNPDDNQEFSVDDDDDWEPPPMLLSSQKQPQQQDEQQEGPIVSVSDDDDDVEQAGTSSGSSIDRSVGNLAAVFPGIPEQVIRNAVITCGSAERAVNSLLSYRSTEESSPRSEVSSSVDTQDSEPVDVKSESLGQVLQRLRSKMSARGMREKIKIDPEDQVMDVFSYYKSPEFDQSIPIAMVVKGQPAVDTGGVLRQVFSEVFLSIVNNEGGLKNVFTGEASRKVPVFTNELVVNGFFDVLGKMVAHSLIQCGTGFPYLTPAIYWYLATEDLQVAIGYASRADVSQQKLDTLIDQISQAPDEELSAISTQSDFLELMSEAGETRILTPANKLDVLQSLMVYDTLVKRKAVLDQFRKGLSTLGLLKEMEKNPQLFEECFIHKGEVTKESVENCLHFEDSGDADSERVFQMLQSFVRNASVQDLQYLLKFITGSHTSSCATLPYRISVSCHESDSFFASCCLLQFKLPKRFTSYAEFELALRVVLEQQRSSFTTA